MRRAQMHLEAELRWHDELDAALDAGTIVEATTWADFAAAADNQPLMED